MTEMELGAAAEATIYAYKELASDPTKRLALALDRTCVQFLAYVLAEGKGTIVQLALDTLEKIATSSDCRSSLAGTFGVLEALQSLADDESYDEVMRTQAAGIFTTIQFARHGRSHQPNCPRSSPSSPVESQSPIQQRLSPVPPGIDAADGLNQSASVSRSNSQEMARSSSSVSNETPIGRSGSSRARLVTLYIKGMTKAEHRQRVEDELVRVRGVISIVFDLTRSRVICRIKRDLGADKLSLAVTRSEVGTAQQVTLGPDGREVTEPISGASSAAGSPLDEDLPDYLPEEDSPIKDSKSAVATAGSLRETATSWLSAAAGFVNKSFYW